VVTVRVPARPFIPRLRPFIGFRCPAPPVSR